MDIFPSVRVSGLASHVLGQAVAQVAAYLDPAQAPRHLLSRGRLDTLSVSGLVMSSTEPIDRFPHDAEIRSDAAARLFDHACLIELEFVKLNLRHDQLNIACPD